jgi:hypothetical protein
MPVSRLDSPRALGLKERGETRDYGQGFCSDNDAIGSSAPLGDEAMIVMRHILIWERRLVAVEYPRAELMIQQIRRSPGPAAICSRSGCTPVASTPSVIHQRAGGNECGRRRSSSAVHIIIRMQSLVTLKG